MNLETDTVNKKGSIEVEKKNERKNHKRSTTYMQIGQKGKEGNIVTL